MSEEEKIMREFLTELKDIKQRRTNKTRILNMMFWEYENSNTHMFEDRDAKIYRIITEKKSYPSSFLGSSLGFNKSSFESKYTEILQKFKLEKKPIVASPRNSLEYEKLKFLIIKLFDKKKK